MMRGPRGVAGPRTPPCPGRRRRLLINLIMPIYCLAIGGEPFPVWWTVKMEKKQNETEDILRYLT